MLSLFTQNCVNKHGNNYIEADVIDDIICIICIGYLDPNITLPHKCPATSPQSIIPICC